MRMPPPMIHVAWSDVKYWKLTAILYFQNLLWSGLQSKVYSNKNSTIKLFHFLYAYKFS